MRIYLHFNVHTLLYCNPFSKKPQYKTIFISIFYICVFILFYLKILIIHWR